MKHFRLKTKNRVFLLFVFLLNFSLSTSSLKSQSTGGGTIASFLLRPTGTRPIALSSSYVAISNDPYTIFYNPAGLATCAPVSMFATSVSVLQYNRLHSSFAYGQSFGNLGIGFGFNSFISGNIIARNQRGDQLGTLTNYNFNLVLGSAYSSEFASFGSAIKYLTTSLSGDDYYSNGFSIDFGSKFNILDLFTFGISIQNVASLIKSSTRSEYYKIPFTLRSGLAFEYQLSESRTEVYRNQIGGLDSIIIPSPEYVLFSFELNFTQFEKYPNFISAIEFSPSEYLAFRGGISILGDKWGKFKLFPMNSFGAGFSIKPSLESFPNLFSIDFSIGNDYLSKQSIFYSVAVVLQF
ncbi:MAG: hypothetical protein ACUVQ1_06550 [Candidatus Kapaibacteriales bacterium]